MCIINRQTVYAYFNLTLHLAHHYFWRKNTCFFFFLAIVLLIVNQEIELINDQY